MIGSRNGSNKKWTKDLDLSLNLTKFAFTSSILLRKPHVGFIFIAFKAMNEFAIEIKVHHARVMLGRPEKKRTTIDL